MIGEIIASYKDQLNENKWIGDNFRKVSGQRKRALERK